MVARTLVLSLLLFVACQHEKPQPIPKTEPAAPVPAATSTGDAACDAYLARVAACTKLSPAMRATLATGGGIWKQAVDETGAPAKAATESCTAVTKLADPALKALDC